MKVAKIKKDKFGFKVIDSRNGLIVKDCIKKGSKAAAIASVYDEKVLEAEKNWQELRG